MIYVPPIIIYIKCLSLIRALLYKLPAKELDVYANAFHNPILLGSNFSILFGIPLQVQS